MPVLISVPHAGRDYPDWLIALCKGGRAGSPCARRSAGRRAGRARDRQGYRRSHRAGSARRRRLQPRGGRDRPDRSSIGPDRLAQRRAHGAGSASFPAGLRPMGRSGASPFRRHELEERLTQAHRPYHRAIEEQLSRLLDRVRLRLAARLPFDASAGQRAVGHHRRPLRAERRALGHVGSGEDRDVGRDSAPASTSRLPAAMSCSGTERRARGVHALQIEIDRRCYLQANVDAPRRRLRRRPRGCSRNWRCGSASSCSTADSPRPPNKKGRPGHAGTAQFREERTRWCAARAPR